MTLDSKGIVPINHINQPKPLLPNYKIHDWINVCLLIPIVSFFIYFHYPILSVILFSISYLFSTFFLSPDLDTDSKPYHRWNILRIFWWPYKSLMTHRGYSHNLIVGPLLLGGYSLILSSPYLFLHTPTVPHELILGFIVAYDLHILVDKIL